MLRLENGDNGEELLDLERNRDDGFESGRADRGMRGSDDTFEISAVSDIWREEGDSGIHYLFIGGSSLRDHGNAGGVLSEECKFICWLPWNSGDPGVCGRRRTACVEEKYTVKYCGRNRLLYVPGSGSILNWRIFSYKRRKIAVYYLRYEKSYDMIFSSYRKSGGWYFRCGADSRDAL